MESEKIAEFLRGRMATNDLQVSGLARVGQGASRETWAFDAAWTESGQKHDRGFILRRDTDVGVVETELRYEYDVYGALQGSGVPVPKTYYWEDDARWVDRPFFVAERVEECEASPFALLHDPSYSDVRSRMGEEFLAVLTALHTLDWEASGFGVFMDIPEPAQAATSQLDYWEDTLNRAETHPEPLLRGILAWLREHVPAPLDRVSVVHGDARVGNFLAARDGEIRAMLDWEMAHLGDPWEDIGWSMHFDRYFRGSLLDRDEFVRRYAEATGVAYEPERLQFWEVLAGVKLSIIFLTGVRSFVDGRSRDMMALSFSGSVTPSALLSLECMNVEAVTA